MTGLDELAYRHGTDKATRHDGPLVAKGYTVHYADLLDWRRHEPLTVLEIGIKQGASIRMWADYLPAATIVALDINPAPSGLDRVAVCYQGSQTDVRLLGRIAAEHGPFDVVIDDGSHRPAHHVTTWTALWPHVAAGGWYAIEDVQTVTQAAYGGGSRSATRRLVESTVTGLMASDGVGWLRVSPRLVIFGR